MQSRSPPRARQKTAWRRLRAAATYTLVAAAACAGLDEDIDEALTALAGPEALDCGDTDGNVLDSPAAADVRACVTESLQSGAAFRGTGSPASDDGGIVVGFASDGVRYWRLDYTYIAGCTPAPTDELEVQECEAIVDRGPACSDGAQASLCFECVNPQPVADP